MASFFFGPDPLQSTFLVPGGNTPATGAQLFIYVAGSVSTKTTVYKDNAGNTAWSNPIVLDSGGNLLNGGVIWIPSGVTIKAVWAPSNDTDPPASPYRTIDNIAGINDTTGSQTEWIAGPTPTFVSANTFTEVGDQTTTFTIGRRLKFSVTAGTVYGRIINSVFGVLTTITMKMDGSTSLDAGLSVVSYALLASKIKSLPERIANTSSSDAYGATVGITAYVAGDDYKLIFSSTNTSGTPTLSLDGLTAFNLVLPDGTRPLPGQLSGEHLIRLTNSSTFAIINPGIAPIRSYLAGLALSASVSSSVMSTAAGMATDSGNNVYMNTSSAIWKTATSWTLGTGNGGLLDSGPVSTNAWYHFYQIKRPDTGVVEIGYSSSSTLPPLPTGYLYKRRIGSGLTNSSAQWVKFFQYEDLFIWDVPVQDFTVSNPGTSSALRPLTTPLGVKVEAIGSFAIELGTNPAIRALVTCPDQTDTAPSATVYSHYARFTGVGSQDSVTEMRCITSVSSQIRVRLDGSGASDQILWNTKGWRDFRGKDQ